MSLKFHFLNVGDGDCTIVDFPARRVKLTKKLIDPRLMMVDLNHYNEHDEYEHVIDYLKQNFENKSIFRFISTHPHKDHLKGIKSLFEERGILIWNFWDLNHNFEPKKEDEKWESYKEDWKKYLELRDRKDDEGLFVRRYWDEQNGKIEYWNEDEITILSPSKDLYELAHKKEDGSDRDPQDVDIHCMPYVLLIQFNGAKIILSSDANEKCWDYIMKNYKEKIKDIHILKAAHHGRLNGFHEEAVKIMNPKHIIFSMTEDTEKKYGSEEEFSKIVPEAIFYKTWREKNIILECDFNGGIRRI